jgi:XTP/dITP diphosphohydrolase
LTVSEILLIGTGNRDKAAELAEILVGLPWEVKSLADMPPVPEPVEDGDTFEANALTKAVYYSRRFDLCCVADDSGLAVDALGGAPGVYSARYAGENCTYADNNTKLLAELASVPPEKRSARFICCAAFAHRSGRTHTETGAVEGRIILEPRGNKGFGYDPLFVPQGFDLTFAEMPAEQKHQISHRGRAFKRLREYLETLL